MGGYDIIGDVHGCAGQLERLLLQLGYTRDANDVYRHQHRSLIFVGDLIDRGPGQLRVLEIVEAAADAGAAQVCMGNHEFSAMAFGAEWPSGSGRHLRRHTEKNRDQHATFFEQLSSTARTEYLEWFRTLPLWLDLGGLRAIHACWHDHSIRVVDRELSGARFTALEQLVNASDPSLPLCTAVETLLKGPELDLPAYGLPAYLDKGGHARHRARLRWWVDGATSVADLAVIEPSFTTTDHSAYPNLSEADVPAADRDYGYTGNFPVYFGHYWRRGVPEETTDWSTRAACVDFSAAKGGALTAYRWPAKIKSIQHISSTRYCMSRRISVNTLCPNSPSRSISSTNGSACIAPRL